MTEHVALYVLADSSSSGAAVLEHIRASDFIDEINSGEGPREECGLYSLIQLVQPADSSVRFKSEQDVLDYHNKLVKGDEKVQAEGKDATWNGNCLLIADKDQEDLVHVLQLQNGKVEQRLKAKARSSVEVASNVSIANMSIQEVSQVPRRSTDLQEFKPDDSMLKSLPCQSIYSTRTCAATPRCTTPDNEQTSLASKMKFHKLFKHIPQISSWCSPV